MVEQHHSAVIKALKILEFLGQADEALPLNQIAEGLGYPESTVHRLLASLIAESFVQQSTLDARYHLGWKIVSLAQSLGHTGQLPQILRPYLRTVVRQVKQSVNLAALDDSEIIYLDSLSPPDRISMRTPPGTTAPVYATAIGKVLLACLPEADLAATLARITFQPLTRRTVTTLSQLKAEIETTRNQGYGLDNEEYFEGVTCVAAPIRDTLGRGIAAISITAQTADLPPNWAENYPAALLAACRQMEQQLNGVS